ncbi:hypothetical protein FHU29_003169 [Hoyosella altamirensis]|uniref:Uncharacterized protein n=2 Tax=Hoyosella TaxID=697025 RepID=F6EHZ4_HOYSD|nr:hypothetical protein AS9A_1491 [Hoyosella subflava DQS3-9A1]MBB3038700.1 hypothetical protein [Hoyosella altamirensis]
MVVTDIAEILKKISGIRAEINVKMGVYRLVSALEVLTAL